MNKEFFIYNPNVDYGGAETSFVNLALALIGTGCSKVTVIVSEGSKFHYNMLNIKNINIEYVSFFNPLRESNALFIFNGQTLRWFEDRYKYTPSNIKIWLMHPDEFHSYFVRGYYKFKIFFGCKFAGVYFFVLNRLLNSSVKLKRMIKNNSILVMDGACKYQANKAAKVMGFNPENIDMSFLPVVTGLIEKIEIRTRPSSMKNFFYFGRVEDFKTKTILKLIYDISLLGHGVLHIIGDGKDLEKIKKYSKRKSVDLICYGFVEQNFALNILNEKADIAFSMGISSLLCAQASIPTVILNPFNGLEPKKIYNYLYDEIDYSVGDVLDDDVRPEKKYILKDFSCIISECNTDWEGIAKKSYTKSCEHDFSLFKEKVLYLLC